MKVYRIIDDGLHKLTTADPDRALLLLLELLEKYEITVVECGVEDVK